jgi:hypothetical protein
MPVSEHHPRPIVRRLSVSPIDKRGDDLETRGSSQENWRALQDSVLNAEAEGRRRTDLEIAGRRQNRRFWRALQDSNLRPPGS